MRVAHSRRLALGTAVLLGGVAQVAFGVQAHAQSAPPPPVYGSASTGWAAPPVAPSAPAAPSETELDLLESTVAVDVAILAGSTQTANTDRAMRALGYVSDEEVIGADVGFAARTVPWLWLGARTGFRARTWERGTGRTSGAIGNDVLAVVQLRLRFARTFDFVVAGGVGLGHVVWQLEDSVTSGLAPRLQGGIQLGVSLVGGLRVFARLGWDYFQWSNADDTDLDVNLGGGSGAAGLEVRL